MIPAMTCCGSPGCTDNCTKYWHHNWVHDCREKCMRGDDFTWQLHGHHLVIYNCGMGPTCTEYGEGSPAPPDSRLDPCDRNAIAPAVRHDFSTSSFFPFCLSEVSGDQMLQMGRAGSQKAITIGFTRPPSSTYWRPARVRSYLLQPTNLARTNLRPTDLSSTDPDSGVYCGI